MRIVLYTPFLSIFVLINLILTDSDFGWALRLGHDMLQSGIPTTDPYSYTMPSYRFVDHEWLTHIMQYMLFTYAHPILHHLVFGLLLILSIELTTRGRDSLWRLCAILLLTGALLSNFIPKPHIISLLFTTALYMSLSKNKYRLFLPLLFLAWANLHGGFMFGIGVLGLWLGAETYERRSLHPQSIYILTACAAATLLNPYGIRLHEEVLVSVLDPQLRWRISEWSPSVGHVNVGHVLLMGVYLTFFSRTWRRHTIAHRVLFVVTFVLGLSSLRNFGLWAVLATPIVTQSYTYLLDDFHKVRLGVARFTLLMRGLFLIICFAFVFQLWRVQIDVIGRDSAHTYPIEATNYILKNSLSGRIFSTYEWGGYLIWKLPGQKVFIDGRMPSWKQKNPPPGESADAMQEFYDLFQVKRESSYYFDRYQVRYLLLPRNLLNPQRNQYDNEKAYKIYDSFAKQLKRTTKTIYKDEVSVILMR